MLIISFFNILMPGFMENFILHFYDYPILLQQVFLLIILLFFVLNFFEIRKWNEIRFKRKKPLFRYKIDFLFR